MKKLLYILLFIPVMSFSQTAFISGNKLLCTNSKTADISVSFNGTAPFTFVYSINGVNKADIVTSTNPFIISSDIAGNYDLISFSDAISVGTISGGAIITILQAPTAVISNITDTIHAIDPSLQFTSISVGNIINQTWNYGDNSGDEIIDNPIHNFPLNAAGLGVASTYQISLIVEDVNSCTDTSYKNIFVVNDYWIYIPNSFSPDNDNLNDKFCIEYSGIRENTFSFYVINREGEIVFESENSSSLLCSNNSGWDGKNKNGTDLIVGTYVYEMYYQEWDGWKNTKHGTINLVR
tara:strand:+ start:8316 stop:9197 length:882 start_codon:yes stop_codon:yes gene_type:complete